MVEQWKQGRLDEHVIRERAECIIRNARKWKIPKTKKTEEERELILKENHEKVCAAAEEAIVLLKIKRIFCRCSRAESWRLLENMRENLCFRRRAPEK